jgi:hypothetical protein
MAFKLFRHKSTGVVASYPEHYADHPSFGDDLEEYSPEEFEEDKVVIETNHELPVDQRTQIVAVPLVELKKDELVESAEKRGLDTTGTKADLVERIADDNKDKN